jgi:F-type H+-transporting ATPase subunit delta
MSIETVARRYATALADVVVKSGETETVKTELKAWEELIAANNDLQRAFTNPAIAHLSKERLLETLIAKTDPSRTTSNFLRILLRNSRIAEIREINDKFAAVLDERAGIVGAEITSARDLTDSERSELSSSIAQLTGKAVKLKFIVDENIIGGVVTRVGSTVYDNSVKTQLENLKQQLVNG